MWKSTNTQNGNLFECQWSESVAFFVVVVAVFVVEFPLISAIALFFLSFSYLVGFSKVSHFYFNFICWNHESALWRNIKRTSLCVFHSLYILNGFVQSCFLLHTIQAFEKLTRVKLALSVNLGKPNNMQKTQIETGIERVCHSWILSKEGNFIRFFFNFTLYFTLFIFK